MQPQSVRQSDPGVSRANSEPRERPSRFRIGWIPAIAVLIVVLAGGFAIWVKPVERPLVVAPLKDGSLLQVWKVSNGEHHWQLRPAIPNNPRLRRIFGSWREGASISLGRGDGTFAWFQRVDSQSGTPLRLDELRFALLEDEHGWTHLPRDVRYVTFDHADVGNSTGADLNQLDQNGKLVEVIFPAGRTLTAPQWRVLYGFRFPCLPAQSGILRLYDQHRQLLGEVAVVLPGASQLPAGTPLMLPITQESGGLAVTLTELRLEPLPEPTPGMRPFHVHPQVTLSWLGGDAAGWKLNGNEKWQLMDAYGNSDELRACLLSPHAPFWNLSLEITRPPLAPYRNDQIWQSTPLKLPAPGEVLDLDQEFLVDGVRIRFHKFYGAGRHTFSTPYPSKEGAQGYGGHSQVEIGGRVTQSVNSQVGRLDWTLDEEVPAIVFTDDGPENYEVTVSWKLREQDRGRLVQGFSTRNMGGAYTRTEQVAALRGLPPDAKEVSVEVTASRPLHYQFCIRPPQLPGEARQP